MRQININCIVRYSKRYVASSVKFVVFQVRFDTSAHDTVGTEAKEGKKYKSRSDVNQARVTAPLNSKLEPVAHHSHLKNKHKNEKVAASSGHKAENNSYDTHFPKTKISSNVKSQHYKPKDLVKLPEINLKPGNNSNMSKVIKSTYVTVKLYSQLCSYSYMLQWQSHICIEVY